MGSSPSKAVKTASKLSARNTARKYPTRSPPITPPRTNAQPQGPAAVRPNVHPPPKATESRDKTRKSDTSNPILSTDTRDPGLQARLQSLGPVQPNPTFSNSSTFNTRPPLQNPAYPAKPPSIQSSSPQSSQSSRDPSLSSNFIPSASNPQQSIFPSQNNAGVKGDVGRGINPAVSLLTARYRLAEEAEREFASLGRKGYEGRSFLDVVTLRQVLVLRDEKGLENGEIERRLGLKNGVVGRLGRGGVVGVSD